ncbi:MAG: hypothetical protein RL324_710 [Verrucomicrobiota bacterium]|jgi:hypothetical protein
MESRGAGIPLLSLPDPEGSGETSLDPLGLVPIGEQLAVELVPGVRERQVHPRYLTAFAVSLEICREFRDQTAADGFSEPWQVFEWYAVEGFVRLAKETGGEARVPGSQKARKALSQGLPLNAARYLKSPSIFGFHGVYRLLAHTLRVEQAGFPGDFGWELLDVWEKEQGLQGFHGSTDGPGRKVGRMLADAVRDGLQKGATDRPDGWAGWAFFHEHLDPARVGTREGELIWRQLRSGVIGFGGEILDFLVTKQGKALADLEERKERQFFDALKRVASDGLRERIDAIGRYEWFCRLLQDAFDACRHEITLAHRGILPGELGKVKAVQRAVERLPDAFAAAEEGLGNLDRRNRFQNTFQEIAQERTPADFVVALYEHHRRVQKAKPPDGKASWLECFADGSLLVRPDYRLEKPPVISEEWVNKYRAEPLRSFVRDLKLD